MNTMKILTILTQSKEEKDKKAVARTARALKRNQEALIDSLGMRKEEHEEVIYKLTSDIKEKDVETWNKQYQKAKLNLALVNKEIEIATNTLTELFTDLSNE